MLKTGGEDESVIDEAAGNTYEQEPLFQFHQNYLVPLQTRVVEQNCAWRCSLGDRLPHSSKAVEVGEIENTSGMI